MDKFKKLKATPEAVIISILLLAILLSLGSIASVKLQKQTLLASAFHESKIQNEPQKTVTIQSFGTQQAQNCQASPDTQNAQQFLQDFNEYRKQNGRSEVSISPTLMQAAAWMAQNMLENNLQGHIDTLGRNPAVRIKDCGYTIGSIAENVAGSSSGYQPPLDLWKNSPGHNENMLNPNMKVIGFAQAKSGSTYRWVLDLGSYDETTPSPTPTSAPSPTKTPSITAASTPTTTISPTSQITSPTPSNTIIPTGPQPTPSITPSITPAEGETILNISFSQIGIGLSGNAKPLSTTKLVTFAIFDTDNSLLYQDTLTSIFDGSDTYNAQITLTNEVATGVRKATLRTINAIPLNYSGALFDVKVGKVNNAPKLTLYPGEVSQDFIFNINDYSIFISCFRKNYCEDRTIIDFDENGQINGVDYNLLLRSFQEAGR